MSKKVIVYGNENCPDCVKLKELFDREGIRYGHVDVLAGLGHLKKFLAVRDASPLFEGIKKEGKVGIPAVVVDDTQVFAELKVDELDLDLFR